VKDKRFLNNLQLLTELGLTIAMPIIVAVLIGAYLDKRFSQSGIFTIAFLIFGLSGGLIGAYRLIKKAADLEDKGEQTQDKDNNRNPDFS
jgi:ATP synthase protein I